MSESFISTLSLRNIENVKSNFQFKMNDYLTYYIVDTFDIIENCLPYVFRTDSNFENIDNSRFLASQFFFFHNKERPIILDQYKVEVFSFWHSLTDSISEFSSLSDLNKKLKNEYKKLNKKDDKVLFIEKHISFLLTLAFGTQSKSPLARYNELVKRLQIEWFVCGDRSDEFIINEIFISTKPDKKRVEKIFSSFCEELQYRLSGKTFNDKFVYLENSYRDIEVFDRIIEINQRIREAIDAGELNNKYNFMYLSSTPVKSRVIESLYKDYTPFFRGVFSNSILRNNTETYLYSLLDFENTDEEYADSINFLDEIKLIIQQNNKHDELIKEYSSILEKRDNSFRESFNEDDLKNIENLFLLHLSVNDQKKKFKNALEAVKLGKGDDELYDLFTSLLAKAEEHNGEKVFEDLKESIVEEKKNSVLHYDIAKKIAELHDKSSSVNIRIYPGLDCVRSLVQSFPVLLFYKNQGYFKRSRDLESVFAQLIKPNYRSYPVMQKEVVLNHPISSFNVEEKKIYFIFLELLSIGYWDEKVSHRDTKQYESKIYGLIDSLEVLISINSKAIQKSSLIGSKLKIEFTPKVKTKIELYYFKTWLQRIINLNDSAIFDLDDLLEEKDYQDERLYHSRALCFKNKYYQERDSKSRETLTQYLKKALDDFLISEEMYMKKLIEYPDNDVLEHVVVAISNSICDTIINLYLMDNSFEHEIEENCRPRINSIKKFIDSSDNKYSQYPAYNHTEADLEYVEALIFYNSLNYRESKRKLKEGMRRMDKINQAFLLRAHNPLNTTKERMTYLNWTLKKMM